MKTYRVKPSTSDIFAVSLVEDEAVESGFVALSKQRPMDFKIEDEEKRMLYGVALRADFPIYRRYGDEEFYLTFDSKAIERLVVKFMSNFYQKNFTVDHMEDAEGIVITESWIVMDTENDKSKALGLENVSKGSWIIGAKINNDEIWQSIKDGRWHGFSIESWIDMEEVQDFNKIKKEEQQKMKEKGKFEEIFDKVKEIVLGAIEEEKEEQPQDVQTEQVEMEEEPIKEEVKEEETAAEAPVEAEKTEETVEEPKAVEEEEPHEEPQEEETAPVEEEPKEDFSAQITEMQTQIDALKAENEKLKEENVKLSKQPSVKPVSSKTENTGVKGALASLRAQGII